MFSFILIRIQWICVGFLGLFLSCATQNVSTQKEKETIINRLNDWHKAAATADEEVFFEILKPEGIYIGTDATEHWTGREMIAWSKQYFDQDTAWDFTPRDRHIFFSQDGKTAWFDELLDTWMGDCRGSGVLQKESGKWYLVHYHLAVAVPNDVIDEYLKLLPQKN